MTKEDIENHLDAICITRYGGKHLGYYAVIELFREVLNDFEQEIKWKDAQIENMRTKLSGTCGNCKYWKQSKDPFEGDCKLGITIDEDLPFTPIDFYCSEWGARSK